MNWLITIIVFGLVIAIIVFLIMRNQKDEKILERQLDNDYPKPKSEEGDIEINELTDSVH